MAEQVQRYRQYEYRANSNLVLTTDQHRPRTDEPSGEPESLKDHLEGTRFGDRVAHAKPDVETGGRKRKPGKAAEAAKKQKRDKSNVLGLAEDIDAYRPRSKETRAAYEARLRALPPGEGPGRALTEPCACRAAASGFAVAPLWTAGRSATRHPSRSSGRGAPRRIHRRAAR